MVSVALSAFAYSPNALTHALGFVTLAGIATQLGALVYLHFARTGLNPFRNAVSQYGITDRRAGYRVQTLAMGTALASAGVAVAIAWRGPGVAVIVALLLVAASSRVAISWYPMDAPGSAQTTTGLAHRFLALIAFVSIADAAWRVSRLLQSPPQWSGLRNASTTWTIVMVIALILIVLTRVAPGGRHVFGLVERVFYVGAMGFVAATGGAFLFIH